jgi:hypothetical protein
MKKKPPLSIMIHAMLVIDMFEMKCGIFGIKRKQRIILYGNG